MKTLTLMILASLSFGVFADDHERAPMSTDGAFITLQVASPDIEKYRQTLIDNPSAFQAKVVSSYRKIFRLPPKHCLESYLYSSSTFASF